MKIGIIGGGAAGYFAAIACKETHPRCEVTLFEAASRPLAKVRISGGGRCNVTTSVESPHELVGHYPRGGRELLGPFTRFGPRETCAWFESRGVQLKTEPDGRVFPVTDSSETITGCLEQAASRAGVRTVTRSPVRLVHGNANAQFELVGLDGDFDRLLLATGSSGAGYDMALKFGHTIVPCVPSLFSLVVKDARLDGLQGVSVPWAHVRLKAVPSPLEYSGPVLITHWGLSGPAILKLSAWGARQLASTQYTGNLEVDWLPRLTEERLMEIFQSRRASGRTPVAGDHPTTLPSRLWARFTHHAGIPPSTTWSGLRREAVLDLVAQIKHARFVVSGRGEFKEEFVTAGGVDLREVDFRRMESKLVPGLFFAGELLDADGLTGGFNLQIAWTTGYLAGVAMVQPD